MRSTWESILATLSSGLLGKWLSRISSSSSTAFMVLIHWSSFPASVVILQVQDTLLRVARNANYQIVDPNETIKNRKKKMENSNEKAAPDRRYELYIKYKLSDPKTPLSVFFILGTIYYLKIIKTNILLSLIKIKITL